LLNDIEIEIFKLSVDKPTNTWGKSSMKHFCPVFQLNNSADERNLEFSPPIVKCQGESEKHEIL